MAIASIAGPGSAARRHGPRPRLEILGGGGSQAAAAPASNEASDFLPLGPLQGLTIPPPRPGLWAELRYLLDALAQKTGMPPATPPAAPPPAPAPEPAPKPAPAPKPEPKPAPKPSDGKTSYINQYSPAGREQGYSNGGSNCGPTSVAMIARAFGYRKDLSDAKLIDHLGGIGHTTGAGTGVNGISAMGQAMGLRSQVKGPGAHVDWIASELRAGRMVVANGDYFAMAPHDNSAKTSGHYVLVYGSDGDGRFLVHDPADRRVQSVSANELATFIKSNPNGGWQISIGK